MISRSSAGGSRAAIVLFAGAIAWIMGVRVPRAGTFENVEFAGKGRATLVIEDAALDPEEEGELVEVFAKLVYGTEISVFGRGLYARSTFTLPQTGESAVLVVDVDRRDGALSWEAGDPGLRVRLYTLPRSGEGRLDGEAVSGSLELEAAIVGRDVAGFRIRGWLELRDRGADGELDSEDDRAFEVDVTLESVPSPEEIGGQPALPPRRPQGGICEVPWCWTDGGYYDGYDVGYGCNESAVAYEDEDDGCEGDTITDDPGLEGDGSTAAPGVGDAIVEDGCSGESGAESYDDSGCEESDPEATTDGCDDGGDAVEGCSDAGSGCEDSGASSGCGSSGCEGDTLGADEGVTRRAGVDLIGFVLLGASIVTWCSDRRRR